ncbi:MAG: hypothetical protein AB1714_17825 [Acidobacteriota bacterium]
MKPGVLRASLFAFISALVVAGIWFQSSFGPSGLRVSAAPESPGAPQNTGNHPASPRLGQGYNVRAWYDEKDDHDAELHCVVTKDGVPVAGTLIEFGVLSGPHRGEWTASAVTNSKGEAVVLFKGDGKQGLDTCYFYPKDLGIDSVERTVDWTKILTGNPYRRYEPSSCG